MSVFKKRLSTAWPKLPVPPVMSRVSPSNIFWSFLFKMFHNNFISLINSILGF